MKPRRGNLVVSRKLKTQEHKPHRGGMIVTPKGCHYSSHDYGINVVIPDTFQTNISHRSLFPILQENRRIHL